MFIGVLLLSGTVTVCGTGSYAENTEVIVEAVHPGTIEPEPDTTALKALENTDPALQENRETIHIETNKK